MSEMSVSTGAVNAITAGGAAGTDGMGISVDLDTAVMVAMGKRANELDRQARGKMAGMKIDSDLAAQLGDVLKTLRDTKSKFGPDDMNGPDYRQNEASIAEAQGKLDSMNNVSQQDTTELQQILNQYQQTNSQVSNVLNKSAETRSGIISNMK